MLYEVDTVSMISVSPTADGSRHLCVQGYQQNVLYLPKKCLCYCSAYVVYRASLDSPKPQNNRHELTNRESRGLAIPVFCKVKLLFLPKKSGGFEKMITA